MAMSASPTPQDLRSAVELAVRAPSIHNTQPWRWALRPDGLDLFADRSRQLAVADPDGHALLISCGAALQLARTALAAAGWNTTVHRSPDRAEPDLLARLQVGDQVTDIEDAQQRVEAAKRRHSDRRPFATTEVDLDLLDSLTSDVDDDGVYLTVMSRKDEALELAILVSRADRAMHSDPAYQRELAEWIRADSDDGIPVTSVPHVEGTEARHTDVPIRDFEAGVTGGLQVKGGQDEHPALTVIMTTEAGTRGALLAGEALARLLVAAEVNGLAASVISQPVDWPVLRERMRGLMGWQDHPQIMVRLGWPSDEPLEPTPRRSVDDVIEGQP